MPYSKEHKEKSREKILASAHKLFTSRGYDAVSINKVMAACKMTRGAFYSHFKSKGDLYRQALTYGIAEAKLINLIPESLGDESIDEESMGEKIIAEETLGEKSMAEESIVGQIWIKKLLAGYLSADHVNGNTRSCPLAFLVTDVAIRESSARKAYAKAFTHLNRIIMEMANKYTTCSEELMLSVTAMIIGAVAIARTMDDPAMVEKLLESCRIEAEKKLGATV
jgi:TetR/AcrR family transcriptional regulator, transcriptional repressor for nem operon